MSDICVKELKKNIVIVEDDPFSKDFYNYILTKAGFNPIMMEDGDEFVRRIKNGGVSLIIMDINLKNTYLDGEKTNGVTLSQRIKNDPTISLVPILLVTAYSQSGEGTKYFHDSLADDYITKPIIDYKSLVKKINSLIIKK